MSTLDKQLARFAQQCDRLDADRWRLALTNGHSLAVSARRDEGFLLFDADAGIRPAPENLVTLNECSCQLPAAIKLALPRGSCGVRLRAEFPLPEESEALGDRIREYLEGMRSAGHRLSEGGSSEVPGEEGVTRSTAEGGLAELLQEAGWPSHQLPGGGLLADLETGSQFLQAGIQPYGPGARFRVVLSRAAASGELAQQAICLYLLEANVALRYARAFFRREEDGIAAGFEVCLGREPSVAEAGHAMGALSVAGRQCARELTVMDGVLAGIYRAARPPFYQPRKGDQSNDSDRIARRHQPDNQ